MVPMLTVIAMIAVSLALLAPSKTLGFFFYDDDDDDDYE